MFSIFYLFVDITHSDEKWETWKILRSYDQFQIHSGRDTRGDQLCHFRSLLIHEYWRLSKINFLYGSPVTLSKNFRACEAADGRGISHRRRPPPALKCVCQPGRQARRQAQGDSGGGLCGREAERCTTYITLTERYKLQPPAWGNEQPQMTFHQQNSLPITIH